MDSWWQLGEWSGISGNELAVYQITCPFCMERGSFTTVYHGEKKKTNSQKKLNFDTLKCENCAGYVLVLWSASSFSGSQGMHGYKVLPWPLKYESFPNHWPEPVGRYWLQAKSNIIEENWDAATLMARSAMQIALREKGAEGKNLKQEIENLANKGVLPPTMKEWSDHVREIGNESAHPMPDAEAKDQKDAQDIIKFLDFLLEYLYDLPFKIGKYRSRHEK